MSKFCRIHDSHITNYPFLHIMLKALIKQGSHKLEKYLNLEGFLEKSLKI